MLVGYMASPRYTDPRLSEANWDQDYMDNQGNQGGPDNPDNPGHMAAALLNLV
jgi:hypothetical protein